MQHSYKLTFISSATDTVIGTGTTFVHSISFPVATTGIVTLENIAGTDYIALPVGTIGCIILDAALPGLSIKTAAADFVIVSADATA